MKAEGIAPNLDTYNNLLRCLAYHHRAIDAWAILEDMILVGVQPDVHTFNYLIEAHQARTSVYLWPIVRKMESMSVKPNATTYRLIIHYFTSANNFECALRYLQKMKSEGIEPDFRTVQDIIQLAAQQGQPRLALDLATSYEKESVRRLEPEVWISCLLSAANCLWKDGVVQCWDYVVQELRINPDEGLCVQVLNTAARHGLPDLATDALRALKAAGIQWQEHHLAPLIESFVNAGQLKEALITLEIMHNADIPPLPTTLAPIFNFIKKDVDSLDAAWAVIDELHQERPIDVVVLNLLLEAAVALGDLQRTIGAYKSFSDYKVKANRETFYSLLRGCVSAGHRDLGDLILEDMKQAGVSRDKKIYELMVELCLSQDTYEDAFVFLEEMKAENFVPSADVYKTLIRKCLYSGDNRYHIAIEEMKEAGHKISLIFKQEIRRIQAKLDAATSPDSETPEPAPKNTGKVGLEGSAKRFIETGGLSQ
ncbi:hypothetical protein K435DRAFT_779042 [Dendrothele bispora CBS 962.96]|uniref:Pentatricopeptide repeat-containing protein-mitochondrial domain-containing protein n=1 Tax=Dendrothele bispora (strain CBS 962.96) TaxID=1314807 RepID=A0A4S8M024_DENBC|nr:hypothetical protein K435DRAFT_779042 [Dendrothele bispora CBS 962.96]